VGSKNEFSCESSLHGASGISNIFDPRRLRASARILDRALYQPATAEIAGSQVGYTSCVRLRPPDPEYLKLLLPYGATIERLALAARELILEEAPEAREFVYEVYTIADHFSFTERPSDAFVFTTTHASWVNLGFNFGSLLKDPEGLLCGEGKLIRHVRIAQAADLDAPGVRQLIRAAIAQAERPEGMAAKPRTVVHRARSGKKRSASGRRRI